MAVVDDLGQPGMGTPPTSEDYGRQPPQDMAAEQSVLGGMLLSKDAIADVMEKLRPGDFYRPAHQNVYDAVLDLYGRGEPADAVTVAAELDRRGLLRPHRRRAVPAHPDPTVPTAANAGYYAEIVAEKALLRRLVEAGTRIVQYGYAGAEGADVDEVVDRAQAEIYDVTERRTSEDYVRWRSCCSRPWTRSTRSPRRAGMSKRRADRLRRPRRPDQRPAPGSDDHRRGPAGYRQGAGARHPAADTDRLDDDGRGRRR